MDRRTLLTTLAGLGIGTPIFQRALAASVQDEASGLTAAAISQAEWVAGIELSEEDREALARSVDQGVSQRDEIRELGLDASVAPAVVFRPLAPSPSGPVSLDRAPKSIDVSGVERPSSDEELAFLSVSQLGDLLRRRKVTSVELTRLYLDRLKRFDPMLHCVVTLTEETALDQASRADQEIAAGRYRGPLHGIPWGAKDLIAYPGYPTTWGAPQYKGQSFDKKATVASRLDDAGAVLVAKLSLGALAMGDRWFGGMTRSPWDVRQGSSGSSAGSASATAAGCVGFALGSETLGSIVSPSRRCGTTGLRPTFGRVSRAGCMPLSWTMDKIGPITRSVQDAALVFAAIHGADGIDTTVEDRGFTWPTQTDVSKLRVGWAKRPPRREGAEETTREVEEPIAVRLLREMGAEVVEIELPFDLPVWAIANVLDAEAATVFAELTDANETEGLNSWPRIFQAARFMTAVDYLQAMRARTRLMQRMDTLMEDVDVYVSDIDLPVTNLTGHPSVVLPTGFRDREGMQVPTSAVLTGRLYDESVLLSVAYQLQQRLDAHLQKPPLDQQLTAMLESQAKESEGETDGGQD